MPIKSFRYLLTPVFPIERYLVAEFRVSRVFMYFVVFCCVLCTAQHAETFMLPDGPCYDVITMTSLVKQMKVLMSL